MLFSSLLIAGVALLAAAVALWIARHSGRSDRRDAEARDLMLSRFDALLEAVGRWREESKTAIQERVGDLYQRFEDQNRSARSENAHTLEQFRSTLTDQFERLQRSNEQKLAEIRGEVEKKLAETLENTSRSFDKVTERLADLRVTNERIIEFTRDLQELQSILQAPRIRGEMGETEMEQMLRQCLAPQQFALQHPLEGGRVDAVIFNPQGELPIDCKFPLEQWRLLRQAGLSDAERAVAHKAFVRAVKEHMDSIAQKYIRPPQTLEFAVMFIPVEGVYYEVIESLELSDHANRCRVIPASPLTFWALLQIIVMGFRGLQISEEARRIRGLLVALRDDVNEFKRHFKRASDQLDYARNNMNEAARHLDRVDTKLETIHAVSPGEPTGPELNLPSSEELPSA